MSYRVQGFVYKRDVKPGESGTTGRVVFHTHDYEAGDWFARNLHRAITGDCHVNVDFEARVPIGRSPAWVDADPVTLDHAAETLMKLASEIRGKRCAPKRKPSLIPEGEMED